MNNKKQLYIIKIGGEIASQLHALNSLCKQIANLKERGISVVLIHGGGQQATDLAKKLGKTITIINGRRVTDEETLDITKMAFAGKVNTDLASALQANGIKAVGISGVSGGTIEATRRPPIRMNEQLIDFGYVGDIVNINTELLHTLLDNDFIPVIASLAADLKGCVFNVNADTAAQQIALALQATRLLLLTNVDGIYDKSKKIIPLLTCKHARELIADGTITQGMIPKIEASLSAIHEGLAAVHIVNGFKLEDFSQLTEGKLWGSTIINPVSHVGHTCSAACCSGLD